MALREITPEAAEAFGRSVYERQVRPTLNGAAEPVGCFLSVDLASADWELDADHLQAALRLRARRPDADLFTVRIGYPAAGEWTSVFAVSNDD